VSLHRLVWNADFVEEVAAIAHVFAGGPLTLGSSGNRTLKDPHEHANFYVSYK
jgi:hypothetical protein